MPSREASLRNLAKARAKWRPPRPWRSAQETRVIKRLVWQWFTYRGPGKWSGRAVAQRLGVTHTYIQKLVREFVRDPNEMQREVRLHGPATFGHLDRAREETRLEKERGWLRSPRCWRVARLKIGDQVEVQAVVPTKASTRVPCREPVNREEPGCAAAKLPQNDAPAEDKQASKTPACAVFGFVRLPRLGRAKPRQFRRLFPKSRIGVAGWANNNAMPKVRLSNAAD